MINLSTYIIENLENDIFENSYTLYHRPKPVRFKHGMTTTHDLGTTQRLLQFLAGAEADRQSCPTVSLLLSFS